MVIKIKICYLLDLKASIHSFAITAYPALNVMRVLDYIPAIVG